MDKERDSLGIGDLKYDEQGLIPAVVQQAGTGEVLMVAYMNAESLGKTIATGYTWFWSRSRAKYWRKGESSGHVQRVLEIRYDCDADTLLVTVDQAGPGACHTGERSCFYRVLEGSGATAGACEPAEPFAGAAHAAPQATAPEAGPGARSRQAGGTARLGEALETLFSLLQQRRQDLPEGSYTTRLLTGPQDALLKKIAEESGEVIMAAKDGDRPHLLYEVADLVYHLLVVMTREGLTLEDLAAELESRRK